MDHDSGSQRQAGSGPLALRLASDRDSRYFYVNWWLTDHCNWDCSYCHKVIKQGLIPFPDIKQVNTAIDQIHEHCRNIGKIMHLDITGGEVTEYPFLDVMLEHARQYDCYIKIKTNAHQSLEKFKVTAAMVDLIEIDFHPEYTQPSHFLLAVNWAAAHPGLVTLININALPDSFDQSQKLYETIKAKWPNVTVLFKMLFDDPVANTQPMFYDPSHQDLLINQTQDLTLTTEQGDIKTDYQTLILEDRNQFLNWKCNIGLEQITIDAYGTVRKGHCRQGGSIGALGKPLFFDQHQVICKKTHCVNGFDILATKQQN